MAIENLVVVRHSAPVVDLKLPSESWQLSDEGVAAAQALGRVLERGLDFGGQIWASGEAKARQTAELLGSVLDLRVQIDPRFGEAARPLVGDFESYQELAMRYLSGEDLRGWESSAEVVSRFSDATDLAARDHEGSDMIVVTHGLAMSLYLSSVGAVDARTRRPVEAADFWASLEMPDVWRLNLRRNWLDRAGFTWDG